MRETNIDKPLHNIIIIIIIIVQIFKDFFLLKPNIYSLMKKITLLLSLTLSFFFGIAQTVKFSNVKNFENKKITSLFKSTSEIRGGWPGVYIAPSNQYQTVKRSVVFQNIGNSISLEKIIHNVNIDTENLVTLEHRIFDTERKFDRTDAQSTVYGMYDYFIDKPFKMIFNGQNIRVDSLTNFEKDNTFFYSAWGDEKLPFLQEHFLGYIQMNLPSETTWKVGQTWENIIKKDRSGTTKNETITNTYTVKSIDNDDVILEVKGVKIPDLVMFYKEDGFVNNTLKNSKTTINDKVKYSVEQKATYEGTIRLDIKNNFIKTMTISTNEYKKIFMKYSPSSGPETNFKVTIENTLEDLK